MIKLHYNFGPGLDRVYDWMWELWALRLEGLRSYQ